MDALDRLVDHIVATDEEVIAGIDEAGRGPVIGPMVYAICVLAPGAVVPYRDSKTLAPARREAMFRTIASYAYVSISAVTISTQMQHRSLNEIARDAVCTLIMALGRKCRNVRCVYVDALGANAPYDRFLRARFPLEFVVENKADSKYPVVSGASIVAKVVRDSHIDLASYGSGYSSDPRTKAWLRSNVDPVGGYPDFVRHSWATVKALLPAKQSRRLKGAYEGFYVGRN
ncbi:ribonuclease H2 subunit A [Pancytospora philotis]|nr:ribonuclease H2 subunit A [Pancytospora philotis]